MGAGLELIDTGKRRHRSNGCARGVAFCFRLLLGVFLVVWASAIVASPSGEPPYRLVVVKSKRLLMVQQGTRTIKKYSVALGRGGMGDKRVAGDGRTPEGVYEVADSWPSETFHYFILLDYPNRHDAIMGFKRGLISWETLVRIYRAQQNNSIPPQHTRIGGFIGIHGIGRETHRKLVIHRYFNWTEGCIALTNAEIDELRQFVQRGTKVIIMGTFNEWCGDRVEVTYRQLQQPVCPHSSQS